jgi:hypothetical protein
MDARDFELAEYVSEEPVAETTTEPEPLPDKMRFPRSLGYGLTGAIIGSLIYAVVGLWIQIGFISILVGGMVGKGMMNGSRGVGGKRYQVTAVLLTYLSVSLALFMDQLWYEAQHGTDVAADVAHHIVIVTITILLGPVAEPFFHLGSGLLDLLIMFFGMQAAWRIAKGDPNWVPSPGPRLPGHETGTATLGLRD